MSQTANRGYPIPDPADAIHPGVRDLAIAIDADVEALGIAAGDVHSDESSSVDGELVLFSGTTGKEIRRSSALEDADGLVLPQGKVLKIGADKVVKRRLETWNTPTGTSERTTFDTETATLRQVARRMKALLEDLGLATGGHQLLGAAFVPSDLTGLTTWIESVFESYVNNDPVGTLTDHSSNACDYTQATSGLKPLFKTGIFGNGLPGVLFDGSDDKLVSDVNIGSILTVTGYTIFVVVKAVTITASDALSYRNEGVLQEDVDSDVGITLRTNGGRKLVQADNYVSTDLFTEQEILLDTQNVVMQRHGSAGTFLSVNGGPYTTQAAGNPVFGARKLILGTGGVEAANFYLGALVICNRDLTSTEESQLLTYLRKRFFFLSSPQPWQTFQRSGSTGSITIRGWTDLSDEDIEASFNGGAYQTIATSVMPGFFEGVLTGQAIGTGTLTVRGKTTTAKASTVANVQVGDNFVVAGQSNASGRGANLQTYTPSGGKKAALFTNAYRWTELLDPSDTNFNQIDAVSNEDPATPLTKGSVWPLVATSYISTNSQPLAFVPTALGGTSITQWLPGTDHQDRTTLYGAMVYRALQLGGVKAALWWHGETDAAAGMAQATYQAHLHTIADAIFADLGVKLMPCKLQHISTGIASQPGQDAINAAIGAAWGVANVLTGPDLTGIDCTDGAVSSDGVHVTTDAGLASVSALWATKINAL